MSCEEAKLYAALIFFLTLAYAIFVEPWLLKRTQTTIELADLPAEFDGFTIVFFSDLHAGGWSPSKLFQQAAALTADVHPDLILIGGDTVVNHAHNHWVDDLAALGKLQAPCGKYAIEGGHDRIFGSQAVAAGCAQLGFTFLANEAVAITQEGATIWLVGLRDNSRLPIEANLAQATAAIPAGSCTIVLAHSPDAVLFPHYQGSLLISGHTHGGQLRIPWLGAILKATIISRKHDSGLSYFGEHPLFVSRGTGSTVKLRFCCRPEVNIITLTRPTTHSNP